jgi:hypothetical protein
MLEKDPDTIIAALLHDAVEDQSSLILKISGLTQAPDGVSETEAALVIIGQNFGNEVADVIAHLTNPNFKKILLTSDDEVKTGKVAVWSKEYSQKYNNLYRSHVVDHVFKNPKATLIKYFDFYENTSTIVSDIAVIDSARAVRYSLKYINLFADFIELFSSNYKQLNIANDTRCAILDNLVFFQSEINEYLRKSV